MLKTEYINYSNVSTLESRIIGGVGIIGGSNIVIIINNRGVGRGWAVIRDSRIIPSREKRTSEQSFYLIITDIQKYDLTH